MKSMTPVVGQYLLADSMMNFKCVDFIGVITKVTDTRVYFQKMVQVAYPESVTPDIYDEFGGDVLFLKKSIFTLDQVSEDKEASTFIAIQNFKYCVPDFLTAVHINKVSEFFMAQISEFSRHAIRVTMSGLESDKSSWDFQLKTFEKHDPDVFKAAYQKVSDKILANIDLYEIRIKVKIK